MMGKKIMIIGHSGAGRTTLIAAISKIMLDQSYCEVLEQMAEIEKTIYPVKPRALEKMELKVTPDLIDIYGYPTGKEKRRARRKEKRKYR